LALRVGVRVGEKTEQDSRLLVLRNVSNHRCRVEGYPRIALFESRGTELPFAYLHQGDLMLTGAHPTVVRLAPGATAFFAINKSPCATSPIPKRLATRIRVTVPHDPEEMTAYLGVWPLLDYCPAPVAGHQIDLTPVEPTARAVFAGP
jgi:hypothetical protein